MHTPIIFIYLEIFWTQLTAWQFLLVLSVLILLCSFIVFLVKINSQTNKIIEDLKYLKKWICLFSYSDKKGKYNNLKGKIKRYISEELENVTKE